MKPRTRTSLTHIYVGTIQIKYKLLQGRGKTKDVTQEVTQRSGPRILFFTLGKDLQGETHSEVAFLLVNE